MRKNLPESLPAFKTRLRTLTEDVNPDMPDTEEFEVQLRQVRNEKLPKARRQYAANKAGVELAILLLDEQNTEDFIELMSLIIDHGCDGAAVMQEFHDACVYVWPESSSKDLGAVFRAKLKKRWGFTKLKKKAAAKRRARREAGEPMF